MARQQNSDLASPAPVIPSVHRAVNGLSGTMQARTMQAAVVTGPGQISVEDVPIVDPGPGEIRVRLEGCGVCASNLGPWAGPSWMQFPTAPGDLGHEGWGTVDAIGCQVENVGVGDRVAALFYNSYAEYDVGPASHVVRLPPSLDGYDIPGEPLGCAMNIFRRSRIGKGDIVAVVGVGFLGALLVRLATEAGARVIALSRRSFALEVAKQAGAIEAIELTDTQSVVEQVTDVTGGHLCNRVIEATGKQVPLDLAGALTRERGRLIIAGYHQETRQVNMQLWNWRGIDVVNAHERDPRLYIRGMREAVRATQAGRMRPQDLITHRYPLDRLGEALDATRDRPHGFLKAAVTFP